MRFCTSGQNPKFIQNFYLSWYSGTFAKWSDFGKSQNCNPVESFTVVQYPTLTYCWCVIVIVTSDMLVAVMSGPFCAIVAYQFVAWSRTLLCCVPTTNRLKWKRRKHPTLCCFFLSVSSLHKVSTAVLSRQPSTDRSWRHWLLSLRSYSQSSSYLIIVCFWKAWEMYGRSFLSTFLYELTRKGFWLKLKWLYVMSDTNCRFQNCFFQLTIWHH